ncbi:MAG: hypothetical protein EBS29_11730 [Chloroflexia bacterium]|nr:hypothetical protein [Chloroflexia bacterium]
MRSWIFILFLGIFTQTIGWIAINYALGHLPAPITSVMLLGQVGLAGGALAGRADPRQSIDWWGVYPRGDYTCQP